MSANTKDDVIEPVLIGPVGVGKTTISRKLGQKLGLPVVSMDDHRDDYYRELGYDDGFAKHLLEKDGAALLERPYGMEQ
jgi:adenylate kinase family enzyme